MSNKDVLKEWAPIGIIVGAFITGNLKDLIPEAQILSIFMGGVGALLFIVFKFFFKSSSGKDINLFKHSVFLSIEDMKVWTKTKFNLPSNSEKTTLFKEILRFSLGIYSDELKLLVQELFKIKESSDLATKVHYTLNSVTEKITLYYKDGKPIPEYDEKSSICVMLATQKFLTWHSVDISRCFKKIQRVCRDSFLFGDLEHNKILALSYIEDLIIDLKFSSMDAIDDINGHLKLCVFRGRVIGD
jgi:hypothetical protein